MDGIRNGKWGFHTENEPNPWWQVDLGSSIPLDRVVLYNRCDGMAPRNSKIAISVSEDGRSFQRVFQHQGAVFYGHTDQKPLTAHLDGIKGRFVRLSLEGTSYFHLDEVEVYPVGDQRNLALGQPATQSSTSTWSARSPKLPPKPGAYPIKEIASRGLQLARRLYQLLDQAAAPKSPVRGPLPAKRTPSLPGVSRREADRLRADIVTQESILHRVMEQARQFASNAPDAGRQALYFEARSAVRRIALANPLLNFDSILFVKRAPGLLPHMSDQHYGWWSRPGGGLCVLEGFKQDQPRVRCLTADMPPGSFIGPDLSPDGRRVLFAYCRYYPEVAGESCLPIAATTPRWPAWRRSRRRSSRRTASTTSTRWRWMGRAAGN